jgi:hypothetical protein
MPFKDFFNESTNASMMRLAMFIMLGVVILLSGVEAYVAVLLALKFVSGLITAEQAILFYGIFGTINGLIVSLLTSSIVGKVSQKYVENKTEETK